MRSLIISCIITLAIALGWYFIYISVEDNTSEFIDNLSDLSKTIEDRQWESANSEFEDIKERWDNIKSSWIIILNHHEIDNIDLAMVKASQYIKSQNQELSLVEIKTLTTLFNIVKDNESLTLSNIL